MKAVKLIENSAVILNTATTSDAVGIGGHCIVGFIIPASFEGTSITFTVSTTIGGTYRQLRQGDTGDIVTIPTTANTYVAIPYEDMQGLQFIKIVSNIAMAADRTITVLSQ
jgi:hypothetical protein